MQEIDTNRFSLFIDIDGTIAEIESTPAKVHLPGNLIDTFERLLKSFSGAVAIITGRSIEDADRLLAPLQMVTAGVHGAQIRRTLGGSIETTTQEFPDDLLQTVRRLIARYNGIIVEPKNAAVAVHYRQAPQLQRQIQSALTELLLDSNQRMTLSQGRMVYEIMPSGCCKGSALRELMREPVFAGRLPIMIGDDSPDEPAIEIANELGGFGLTVAGEHFAPEIANFRSVADVRAWLLQLSRREGQKLSPTSSSPVHAH